jgi:site-specific recombinase XerD
MALTASTTRPHEDGLTLPVLVAAAGVPAQLRFLEFFAARIHNLDTRRVHASAAHDFLGWCAQQGVVALDEVQPLHVAAWIERLSQERSASNVKQQLAAIRHLFDWLVAGQVVPSNPAAPAGLSPSATAARWRCPGRR